MEFHDYLAFLERLRQELDTLSAVEQQKIAAVRSGDLAALDACMKQEQAAALSLRGREQHRKAMLRDLGLGKLTKAQEALSSQHTQLDTQSQFLKTNQSQLESTFTSLNTELNSIENIDQVEAILTLVSAQTSYNAALQVGANVVPQSLMDYLN